jgi:hypothetical protein
VSNLLGQYSHNVLNFRIGTVVGGTVTDQDFAVEMEAMLAPLYKNILATNCEWYGLKAQIISPTRFDAVFSFASRGAGTLAGDCLPTQTAGVMALRTGFAARARMGRVYFPATSEAQNQAAAVPGAAYTAGMSAIGAALLAGGTVTVGASTVDWIWVVRSRELGLTTAITQYLVRTNWGTIRRRSHIGPADAVPF